MDCIADPCTTQSHAWVEATRITREDGSDAWLVAPQVDPLEIDPDGEDAFDGWLAPPSPTEKLPEAYAGDELYLGGFCTKCGRPTGRKDDVEACSACW
jgi:hypothetical protein